VAVIHGVKAQQRREQAPVGERLLPAEQEAAVGEAGVERVVGLCATSKAPDEPEGLAESLVDAAEGDGGGVRIRIAPMGHGSTPHAVPTVVGKCRPTHQQG
jgi:hypothetical protein